MVRTGRKYTIDVEVFQWMLTLILSWYFSICTSKGFFGLGVTNLSDPGFEFVKKCIEAVEKRGNYTKKICDIS